jgi:hypothetical protein
MQDNSCLEKLKKLKLEHQEWFNDISRRLNLLLIDKKKVKFESISKVASKWVIPVDSDLKRLEGMQDIQKLILIEVQEYQKIFNLINKPLETSFFKSRTKAFQRRDDKIVFHSDVLSNIYKQIVVGFNALEKDLILGVKKCSTLTATVNVAKKKTLEQVPKNKTPEKTAKVDTKKKQEQESKGNTPKTTIRVDEKPKVAPSKESVSSKRVIEKTKEQDIDSSIMLNGGDLLSSLDKNRFTETEAKEGVDVFDDSFSLEEEIKKIIG